MREDEAEVSASCRDTRWKERALTRQGLLEGSCERALAANLYTNGQLPPAWAGGKSRIFRVRSAFPFPSPVPPQQVTSPL